MSISSSAVLVELNISVWPASKVDRETTDAVNANASAVRDASQTKKNLFAGTSMRKDIDKFAARVRLYHNQHTLPWADKGQRLLPTKLFMEYKQTMDAHEHTFNMMCNNFYAMYPQLVQDASVSLGSLYKASDYPDIEEVKGKFGFRRSVDPIPESGDFRLDVSAEDLADLKNHYEQQYSNRIAEAMRAPWERLHTTLTAMSEKLTERASDQKVRYHDSLLTNAQDLCSLLTKLNVTNDPKLEEARQDLERALVGADMDGLKEDSFERHALKNKVDAIIGKFNW